MYVKLFGSILDSSIWAEDASTRLVWITMLAMANKDGFVASSITGLARRANVPLKDTRKALQILASPDDDSGSPEYDGRRIEAGEGGWILLNYQKYREIQTQNQRDDARRQRLHYQRTKCETSQTSRTEAEANANAEVEQQHLAKMDLVPTRDRPIVAKSVAESLKQIGQLEIVAKELLGWQIKAVFAYWVSKMDKDNARTKLTLGRWDRLKKYITLYDIETCLYAIDGAKIHPHANQENGRTYHEFPEIFMNKPEGPDRVEKYSEYARKKDRHPKHQLLEKHPQLEGQ